MSDAELTGLYPFLHGRSQDRAKLDAALLASIADKARASRETNERCFSEQALVLLAAARALAECYRRGGRLFCMGNGGSSCDAAHVTVEFLHPVTAGRPALAAINLTADVATLSALANDLGFEHVFVRQLVALARRGDALLGASTSGNSANLVAAFLKAKELGMTTIAFSGNAGGKILAARAVDHALIVPSSSVHRIQESHVTAYHILWDLVHTLLADDRGAANSGAAR